MPMINAEARRAARRTGGLPEINSGQLAAALAVAEYRSFIAAAAHLGITQPAMTLAIKRLERTLGVQLFARTTRQVTVTAAGREFVAMAERVLNDMKLGIRSLNELSGRPRGQVFVTSLIHVRMSSVIAEYTKRFPGIEIHLREGLRDDVRDDVRSGFADFGIGNLGDLPGSFATESLGMQQLSVILRRDHPLARARQIEFSALREVPLVSFRAGSDTRRVIDSAATVVGFSLNHIVTVSLALTMLNLVIGGVGVAVVPELQPSGKAHPSLVSRRLIRPRLVSEIGIMRLRDRELSPAAASLLALTRKRLRIEPSRRPSQIAALPG
jgi:DNA-binding transcriptional LysR family regulator